MKQLFSFSNSFNWQKFTYQHKGICQLFSQILKFHLIYIIHQIHRTEFPGYPMFISDTTYTSIKYVSLCLELPCVNYYGIAHTDKLIKFRSFLNDNLMNMYNSFSVNGTWTVTELLAEYFHDLNKNVGATFCKSGSIWATLTHTISNFH